jgi:acyl-CoA thioester hydrolase
MEADRYVMEYKLVSHEHRRVAAEGEGLIVSYDYREKRKAPLPEELKRRIQSLENNQSESGS